MIRTEIIIAVLTIFGSAFFSGTETALISANKIKLQLWRDRKNLAGWLSRKFTESPSEVISILLVGNNIMNICTTVLVTDIIFRFADYGAAWSAVLVTLITTPPVLLFGEIVPKNLGREHANSLIRPVSYPLYVFYFLLTPIAKVTQKISIGILKLMKVKYQHKEQIFTRANIQRVIADIQKEGVLESDEKDYIAGVFEFGETIVREVMTPRTEIVALANTALREEIARKMFESGFSRIPMYDDSLDHIIGTVHVKDVVIDRESDRPKIHPVIFTPETKKCDKLLLEMRQKRCHFAVVLDEYGGTSGIVTLEDLMEQMVGDISDVHDVDGMFIRVGRDRSIIVDGRTRLEDLEDKIELPESDYEVETIGGLLVSALGRIPETGEKFAYGKVKINVLESTPKRVKLLQLRLADNEGDWKSPEDDDVKLITE